MRLLTCCTPSGGLLCDYRFSGAAAPCSGVQGMYKLPAAAFAQCILQWTLVNPDRVNPKPRKSEVQNQLINN